jgi:hypothetical protein
MGANASTLPDILSKEVLGSLGLTRDGSFDLIVTQRSSLVDGQDAKFFIKRGDTVVWDNGILEAGVGERKTALRMRENDPDYSLDMMMRRKSRDPSDLPVRLLKRSGDPRLVVTEQRTDDITGTGVKDENKASHLTGDE